MLKIFSKKNRGSLTVEAALVLPLVIITLLFTVNLLNICMVNTCMQQALNNTAKKVSQDAYLVYRFAGEDNYASFINFVNSSNDGYDRLSSQLDETISKFNEVPTAVKTLLKSWDTTVHTFDGFTIFQVIEYGRKFIDNIKDLFASLNGVKDASINFAKSIVELVKTGRENFKDIIVKLLLDEGAGFAGANISERLFNKYRQELGVPASKISNLNFFHSRLNRDGSFTLVISYLYENPFSFVNQKSLEYSVINKEIRMTNAITIKPFVGKHGTSLIGSELFEDLNTDIVYITSTAYDLTEDNKKYHKNRECRTLSRSRDVVAVRLDEAKSSEKIDGPCSICYPDGEPTS